MLIRALLAWLMLRALAVVNGAVREAWLIPRIGGRAGHAASSLSLSAAILLLAWLTIAWIDPASARDAFLIGLAWLALTLAFAGCVGRVSLLVRDSGVTWRVITRTLCDRRIQIRPRLWTRAGLWRRRTGTPAVPTNSRRNSDCVLCKSVDGPSFGA